MKKTAAAAGPGGTGAMQETLRLRTVKKLRLQPPSTGGAAVPLNALDHFESWFLLEVVYFYEQDLDPGRLRQSLEKALAAFPLLCGRLRLYGAGRLAVDPARGGPLLSLCESDLPFARVCSGLHRSFRVYDFIEKNNPLLLPLGNRPLATFKITRFRGGGTALGISCAHALTDGVSFYQFIRYWSAVHEGLPAEAPLLDRSLPEACGVQPADDTAAAACGGFRRLGLRELCRLYIRFLLQQQSTVCCSLPFTAGQAAAVKKAAQQHGPVSLNDALCAHLWQFCCRLNPRSGGAAGRRLLMPVNMRQHLNHPLADRYFGNAVSHALLELPQAGLAEAGIAELAAACRQQIASLDAGLLRRQMQWLGRAESQRQMFRIYADIDPYAGDCMISNLSRLPVSDARFDGCLPVRAEVPVIPIPWVLQVFPAADAAGGIVVHAHLPRAAADRLRQPAWQAELYKYGSAGA